MDYDKLLFRERYSDYIGRCSFPLNCDARFLGILTKSGPLVLGKLIVAYVVNISYSSLENPKSSLYRVIQGGKVNILGGDSVDEHMSNSEL